MSSDATRCFAIKPTLVMAGKCMRLESNLSHSKLTKKLPSVIIDNKICAKSNVHI